jgi:hypothetical protein
MKVERLFLAFCVLPLLLASCKTNEPRENTCVLHVLVNLPDSCKLSYESITIEDRNMGTTYRISGGVSVGDTCLAYYSSLPVGFYDLTFNATVQVSEDYSYALRAYNQNVTVKDTTDLIMEAFVLPKSNDFVIAEVFFAGTQTPQAWGMALAQAVIPDPKLASLACAVAILVLITALLWPLHRRAIHFRL